MSSMIWGTCHVLEFPTKSRETSELGRYDGSDGSDLVLHPCRAIVHPVIVVFVSPMINHTSKSELQPDSTSVMIIPMIKAIIGFLSQITHCDQCKPCMVISTNQ